MTAFWKRKKPAASPGPEDRQTEPAVGGSGSAGQAPADSARGDARLRLLPLHGIYVELAGGRRIDVVNIASDGVGLFRNSQNSWPDTGARLKGQLVVGDFRSPVELEIVHITGLVVGCRGIGLTSELRDLIRSYLDVELAASRIREANPKILRKDPEGDTRWFIGPNNCELFLVHQNERLIRFELSLFGVHFTGGPSLPLKYGFVIDDEGAGEVKYKGSAIVRSVSRIPADMMQTAIRFVENVPSLSPALRSVLAESIRRGIEGR